MTTVIEAPSAFETEKLGGGGYIIDFRQGKDGDEYCRTDTYGYYRRTRSTRQWRQMLLRSVFPLDVSVKQDGQLGYVRAIAIAPSNNDVIYIEAGGLVFHSANSGVKLTKTTAVQDLPLASNGGGQQRLYGETLVVDPAVSSTVYRGTLEFGLWATNDSGKAWRKCTDVPDAIGNPKGFEPGITGIAVNPTSPKISRRHAEVWACSSGNGYWRSKDAGNSFQKVAGGPLYAWHAEFASDGVLYVVDGKGLLWVFENEAWRSIAPPTEGAWSVSVNPFNPKRILVGGPGGRVAQSIDGGETFGPKANYSRSPDCVPPWHFTANNAWMSNGAMRWDLFDPDKINFAEGSGVWTASFPVGATAVVWKSESAGIEQLVPKDIVQPWGTRRAYFVVMDRACFQIDADVNQYPFEVMFKMANPLNALCHGRSITYLASNPDIMAGVTSSHTNRSSDGGKTWTPFKKAPFIRTTYKVTDAVSTEAGSSIVKVKTGGHFLPSNIKGPMTFSRPVALAGIELKGRMLAQYVSPDYVTFDAGVKASETLVNVGGAFELAAEFHDITDNKTGEVYQGTAFGARYHFGSELNMVAEAAGSYGMFYTLDGAESWERVTAPDDPFLGYGSGGEGMQRMTCAADPILPNTFYFIGGTGIHVSRDGGKTLEKTYLGKLNGFSPWHNKLRIVPDRSGVMFFTGGPVSGEAPSGQFHLITNGGKTVQAVADVLEVLDFGFSAPMPGSSVPTLSFPGWVKGIYGTYRCSDWDKPNSADWTYERTGDGFPNGWLDRVSCWSGDSVISGRIYGGYSGAGFFRAQA